MVQRRMGSYVDMLVFLLKIKQNTYIYKKQQLGKHEEGNRGVVLCFKNTNQQNQKHGTACHPGRQTKILSNLLNSTLNILTVNFSQVRCKLIKRECPLRPIGTWHMMKNRISSYFVHN